MSTRRVDTRERVGQTNNAARQLISPFPSSTDTAGPDQTREVEEAKANQSPSESATPVNNDVGLQKPEQAQLSTDVQPNTRTDTAAETTTDSKHDEPQDDFTRRIEQMITSPKKGYLQTHTSRSYYIDNDLIKDFDQLAKKYNLDKSDVVNDALRIYLTKFKERASQLR